MTNRIVNIADYRLTMETLRREGYLYLVDMVGIDRGDRLGVIVYISQAEHADNIIAIETYADSRENPSLPTISNLWAVANVYEREVYDFFGIRFEGHPDLRRIFLRSDWRGYPLRKDYDETNPIPTTPEDFVDDFDEDDYVVNFGPQHPAMHGVLHLRVALNGEIVTKIDPNFGYIHRGIEKMCESYTYPQILHLTDRLDYLSATMNRHAFCMAVEQGLQIEVPRRAQYIRTITDELSRIASHLLGWGCMAMDMGSITAFVYGMRDREKILDIFEESGGGRMFPALCTIGGLTQDVHPNFQHRIAEFVPYMRKMLREHHLLFTHNPISEGRMRGVGQLLRKDAISLGITGPSGRASGWRNDLRKSAPYGAYADADFEEVIRNGGDCYDRYLIRLDEIEQSLRIIEQLNDKLPEGAVIEKPKPVVKLPEGDFFARTEASRGQFGVHISSDGSSHPTRVKFRSPCMPLVGGLKHVAIDTKISDLIMLGASFDYVIPCIDR